MLRTMKETAPLNSAEDVQRKDTLAYYEPNNESVPPIKVYKKRWLILTLYVLYMVCNSSQWLQYSMIPNAVMKYYGVKNWQVDITSMIVMVVYVPLALPGAYFMDKINLRWTAILGSLGTAVGSWVKVGSVAPDRFYVTLTGQTIVGISQVLMLSVPQKLSSVWFGENEVSSACSIGVFGFQFGIVLGFFLPPTLVRNHENISIIGNDLFNMFLYFATVSTMAAVLVLLFFKAEPAWPPTASQAAIRARAPPTANTTYVRTLKRLFSQRHLAALFVTTGVNNGCFNGLSTLLSQIFLEYFPGHEDDAGRAGVIMVVFGMTSSVVFGIILDRTKRFKLVLVFMYYMSGLAMLTLTLLFLHAKSVIYVYAACAFVGTFLCGFTAISFDVATEVSYPESELIVGTIMNMTSLLCTFAATLIFGFVNSNLGYFWGNIGFVVTLLAGSTLTLPIEFPLKRTNAQRSNSKVATLEELIGQ